MIDPRRLDQNVVNTYLQYAWATMTAARVTRLSWWGHWSQIAEVFLPRRYRWFVTPNQWNRGSQLNGQILDETGVKAAETLTAGMISGMTSPIKQWFKFGLSDLQDIPPGPVKEWLDECTRRAHRVLAESNFYQAMGQFYHDIGVFATAAMLIYEDGDEVIRCQNPYLGEFFFMVGPRNTVDAIYREFVYTVDQAVREFGLENCSISTQTAWKSGGNLRQQEIIICHAIEPNTQIWQSDTQPQAFLVPKSFAYREAYWEQQTQNVVGPANLNLLRVAGYREKPFIAGRWATTSNDPYGTGSPGMNALPATRQLQVQAKRLGQAIDKMVNPPMVASVSMKNEPASILPGSVNYVADISTAGFKPAYQVDPRVQELGANIAETQQRVQSLFYADLFLMISQLDTVRTATEIDARREEKLLQLGPVVTRLNNEVLDPILERVWAIMERRGLIPEPPQELAGMEVDIQYISMLAEAQKAAQTAAIERGVAFVGNLAAVNPDILDNLDWDKTVQEYFDDLSLPAAVINAPEVVAGIRRQRAAQQQQQQMLEATPAAVDAAKTLSETQLGGGQSALAAMMNG